MFRSKNRPLFTESVSKKNVEKNLFWRACAARTKKLKKQKKTKLFFFFLFYHLKVFVLKSSTVVHVACSLAICQLSQELIARLHKWRRM